MEIFAFCVIIHEPIKIQTCSAPQNDRLNFVFMKDIYVDSEKVARNSSKTAIQLSQILGTTLQLGFAICEEIIAYSSKTRLYLEVCQLVCPPSVLGCLLGAKIYGDINCPPQLVPLSAGLIQRSAGLSAHLLCWAVQLAHCGKRVTFFTSN